MKKSHWLTEFEAYNKKKQTEPYFFNTTLTPEDADYILELNTRNRRVTSGNLNKLLRNMNEGEWTLNGETIIISPDELANGQHRLLALKEHGKPLPFSIALVPNQSVFRTIDTGRSRSSGDILKINGYKDTNNLAAALSYLLKYQNSEALTHKGAITSYDVLDAAKKYPHMSYFGRDARLTLHILPLSQAMFLMYVFATIGTELSNIFFYGLQTGEDLKRGDPILMLRNEMIKNRERRLMQDKRYNVAAVIMAWNAYVSGEKLSTIRWDGVDFPVIAGVNRKKLFSKYSQFKKSDMV